MSTEPSGEGEPPRRKSQSEIEVFGFTIINFDGRLHWRQQYSWSCTQQIHKKWRQGSTRLIETRRVRPHTSTSDTLIAASPANSSKGQQQAVQSVAINCRRHHSSLVNSPAYFELLCETQSVLLCFFHCMMAGCGAALF